MSIMKKGFVYKTLEKISNLFFPEYFTRIFLFETGIFKTRLSSKKRSRKYAGKKELYVNVGAGESGKGGWVNVDVFYHPRINLIWDCRKSIPLDNDSVKFIFTEHFI